MTITARERVDEHYWELEQKSNQFITAILMQLSKFNLDRSTHSKAVQEFSLAVSSILKAYQIENLSYAQAEELLVKLKYGFIDGVRSINTASRNRKHRSEQRPIAEGSYRRNMTINNQSFNVRFRARCATSECLMRGANYDLQDDAFQEYIEAASKDKQSDIMNVVHVGLIAAPYAKPLEVLAHSYSFQSAYTDMNLNPGWAYAAGKGAAYRLSLLGVPRPVTSRVENLTSYVIGSILNEREQ
ncbi:hypothetical protein KP803_10950 [Vibrio sp. ZSDE26]|uniref:Uncharacterized protein n=1 Tax=Vibrio amylolyticus TaxID=2847292 RepID=A0A9X1XIY3_9VIBR|nr:hypothetical protein [Vibrio amylolyticus]MCK6263789.1 hypothetical protein [Vibrio amylolyticus]